VLEVKAEMGRYSMRTLKPGEIADHMSGAVAKNGGVILSITGTVIAEDGDYKDEYVHIECVKAPGAVDVFRVKFIKGRDKCTKDGPWLHEFVGEYAGDIVVDVYNGEYGDEADLTVPTFNFADAFGPGYCEVSLDGDNDSTGKYIPYIELTVCTNSADE
jgi:hypothetical protein